MELARFDAEGLRQKMKNFRASYTKANDWRHSTGSGLSEENSEKTISGKFREYFPLIGAMNDIQIDYVVFSEHLNKKCPFWDYLDEIYSPKTSLNPVALYESGQPNPKDETHDLEYIVDDLDIDFADDGDISMNSTVCTSNSNEPSEIFGASTPTAMVDETETQSSMTKRLEKKPRANQNNSAALLLEVSKMRDATTKKKLELEERKIALEEKRSERDFEIRKMEAETRKLEAENMRMQLMNQFASNANQSHKSNVN